jgi:ankyrin repeat protein
VSELHLAAYNGDAEWVRRCLLEGADPNAYDESGYCPLHWIAFRAMVGWTPVEVARLLLQAGADIHATTKCEVANSALVLACQVGSGDLVRLLIESGADINARCGNTTPLIAASMSGCAQAVRLLLSLEADTAVKGPFGMTAPEWADSRGFDEIIDAFRGAGALAIRPGELSNQ